MKYLKNTFSRYTAIGGRETNQDFISDLTITRFGELTILCDGMGGASGGEVASKMAHDIIKLEILSSKKQNASEAIRDALIKANNKIYERAQSIAELKGMGTTVVVLLVNKESATYGYIGDSRLYHIREKQIIFKTWDHSKVYEMVRQGIISEKEAADHPESNIILKALGGNSILDISSDDIGSFSSKKQGLNIINLRRNKWSSLRRRNIKNNSKKN